MSLPNPGMTIDRGHTALLVTDPQNDFLSERGETLPKAAKGNEIATQPITSGSSRARWKR